MDPRTDRRALALMIVALVVAVGGAAAVSSFHREYGDITQSGLAQGLRPGLMVAVLALVPASLAVVLGRRRMGLVVAAAAVVVGAVVGTVAGTQMAVTAKEAAMPRMPLCLPGDSGDAGDEQEPAKAVGADQLDVAAERYADVFAELPSPGHFAGGQHSVDGCAGTLVDVTVADAQDFYERVLPTRGWSVSDRAPGRVLEATRDDLTFRVGADGAEGLAWVEVFRTASTWVSAAPG